MTARLRGREEGSREGRKEGGEEGKKEEITPKFPKFFRGKQANIHS